MLKGQLTAKSQSMAFIDQDLFTADDDEMSMEVDQVIHQPMPEEEVPTIDVPPDYSAAKTGLTCLPQRAALLKSMLNFLKKAIQVCLNCNNVIGP